MGVLGHKVFEKIVQTTPCDDAPKSNVESLIFHFKGGCRANGVFTNEGFAVLKGSEVKRDSTNSCPEFIKKLRLKYDSIIGKSTYTLTEDCFFTSVSTAAGFVAFGSRNGNKEWITDNGITPNKFSSVPMN